MSGNQTPCSPVGEGKSWALCGPGATLRVVPTPDAAHGATYSDSARSRRSRRSPQSRERGWATPCRDPEAVTPGGCFLALLPLRHWCGREIWARAVRLQTAASARGGGLAGGGASLASLLADGVRAQGREDAWARRRGTVPLRSSSAARAAMLRARTRRDRARRGPSVRCCAAPRGGRNRPSQAGPRGGCLPPARREATNAGRSEPLAGGRVPEDVLP